MTLFEVLGTIADVLGILGFLSSIAFFLVKKNQNLASANLTLHLKKI